MYNPKREEEILAFWNEKKIFEKSLEKTKNGKPFVFYDGPPFASGMPHFGHVLPTTIKDIIPRYQTMKGRYVPRVWGWDCHGLPIENLVEKKLGLKNKKDIEEFGVEKFNIEARNSVFTFVDEWKKIIPRLGRFVDMENDYRTMDPTFTESVWWSFKTLYDNKLAFEGFYSMHLCPHCETVLSNFEVGQGYKDITDISVYVSFELLTNETKTPSAVDGLSPSVSSGQTSTHMLVWTTTPWTLPGNVALAVNPVIDYVKIKAAGRVYILAKERLEALSKILGQHEVLEEIKGKKLIGLSYKPLFDYYSGKNDLPNKENGWKIYGADFVTTTDGTGVVHIAPAFGEDDLNLGNKEKLPFVQHVGMDGRFKEEMGSLAGLPVKPKSDDSSGHQKTDVEIIRHLAQIDSLFGKEKIIHSYPHCWRCDTPLINYATSSWFIKVTEFQGKLVKENAKIGWNPEHVGIGRFGKWLENARDWAISRTRYWGAPLPIWKSEDGKEIEVIGSLGDLKSKIKRNNYIALRHAEAAHNVVNIMRSGLNDGDHLTELGKKAAEKLVKMIKEEKIDVMYISPLERTRETAELLKQASGFKGEIIVDERLAEEKFGDLEGKPNANYINYYKEFEGTEKRLSLNTPNGESLLDVRKRVSEFLYEIDGKHENKNILVITHDGVIKMIKAVSEGGTKKDLLAVWGPAHNIFLQPGQYKKMEFVSLPKNELHELDLHRPYIDEITWKSKSGKKMIRIKDVFDTWYDSGSMPFASKHYPFENKKEFESGLYFPADFISEGVDQTRGWFYSLIVLGVGLFKQTPYKNVTVSGLVLGEDGRKLSKKFNNFPDLRPTLDKYGADSLRYFLASSPAVKAEDVAFSEKFLDEIVKKHFNRLYNVVSLFDMYKGKVKDWNAHQASKNPQNPLDAWLKARLSETGSLITKHLDSYELDKATKPIGDFIDDLSVWYIRRSRDRFKSDDANDRDLALSTTRHILLEFSKLMAPFIPFVAEDIYQRVLLDIQSQGAPLAMESVHLTDWPGYKKSKKDEEILKQMEEIRKVVTLGLELRNKSTIKVRQPLARLMVREDSFGIADNEALLSLIKDEVNVKEVIFDANISDPAVLDTEISEELRKEGIVRDVIRAIQEIRKEKSLSPGEKINVAVRSAPEIHHIVSEYREMISKVTSVENFLFEESGESNFTVRIL